MNGEGVLAKYVKYRLDAYVCVSLSFPKNKVFFFSSHQNQGGGERSCKKSGIEEDKKSHPQPSTLISDPHKHPQDFTRLSEW